MIHDALSHRHLREVAVTICAVNTCTNMRRMIESHVGLFEKTIDALPRQIFLPLRVLAQGLNAFIRCVTDILMTAHAKIHARNSRTRASRCTRVAVRAVNSDLVYVMNLVRKIDRLLRLWLDAEEVLRGVTECLVRGRKSGRTPSLGRIRVDGRARVSRDVWPPATESNEGKGNEQRDHSNPRVDAGRIRLHSPQKKSARLNRFVPPFVVLLYGQNLKNSRLTPGATPGSQQNPRTYHTPSGVATPPPRQSIML